MLVQVLVALAYFTLLSAGDEHSFGSRVDLLLGRALCIHSPRPTDLENATLAKTTPASARCTRAALTVPRSPFTSRAPIFASRPRSLAHAPAKAQAKAELRARGIDVSVAGKAELRAAFAGIQSVAIAEGAARAQAAAEEAVNSTVKASPKDQGHQETPVAALGAAASAESNLWKAVLKKEINTDYKTAADAAASSIAAADEAEAQAALAGATMYVNMKKAASCAQKAEKAAREAEKAAFAAETHVRNTKDAAAVSAAYAAVVRAQAATAAAAAQTFKCSAEGWKQAQEDTQQGGDSKNRDPWWPIMKASMDTDEVELIPKVARRIQAAFNSAKRAEASAARFAERAKASAAPLKTTRGAE